jgi:excisionase family DNA binding protein
MIFTPPLPVQQRLQYSIEEAAALLGISKHTVIRDINRGRIQVQRYGKRVLVPHGELIRIATEGMTLPEKEDQA